MDSNAFDELHQNVLVFMKQQYPDKNISKDTLREALEVYNQIKHIHTLDTQFMTPPVCKGIPNRNICKFINNFIDHTPQYVRTEIRARHEPRCSSIKKKYKVGSKAKFRHTFQEQAKQAHPKECSRLLSHTQRDSCFEKFHNFNNDYTFYMDKC